MICRARPKYLRVEDIGRDMPFAEENSFYFNRGSKAFQFFLECHNAFYHKEAKVAIQSFTCVSMLEAIVRSGSHAYIYDVSLEDASLSYELIENANVDVIVLTHYQGIPNKDYVKFYELCRAKNIILFEDLSHGTESKIDGIKIGSYASAYIESYAFDKPYTVLHGGKLGIGNVEKDFRIYIESEFEKLPFERHSIAKRELKMIPFLMLYTSEKMYYEDFDYSIFVKKNWLRLFWKERLFQNDCYRKMLKIIYKIAGRISFEKKAGILRMDESKIKCICSQRKNFAEKRTAKKTNYLEIESNFETTRNDIVWNRYSLIDADGDVRRELRQKGICAGNYNWAKCLHDYSEYIVSPQVTYVGNFASTDYLKEHMLNVPVWQCEYFQN